MVDGQGETNVLTTAVRMGHADLVRQLLEAGADPDDVDLPVSTIIERFKCIGWSIDL